MRGDYLTDIDLTALIKIMTINIDLDKFWWLKRAGWPYLSTYNVRVSRYSYKEVRSYFFKEG